MVIWLFCTVPNAQSRVLEEALIKRAAYTMVGALSSTIVKKLRTF